MRAIRGRWSRVLACLLAFALSACDFGGGDGPGRPISHVVMAEVYPNGNGAEQEDQFIRLYNPTSQPVTLAGWSLGDTHVRAVFPASASIGPGQSLYAARDAEGFQRWMGAPPDFAWGKSERGTAPLLQGGGGFVLGREKGAVMLRNQAGKLVDAVVYGQAAGMGVTGWKGAAIPAPRQGEVIDRARDEATWSPTAPGTYVRDTDTASDWKQGDAWVDLRIYRPGQTWFAYPTYTVDSVTAYASPDSAFQTLNALLDRARASIDVTVYDFSLVPVAERLAAAARRGVRVRLLIEARSVNGASDQERFMAKVVAEAGGEVRWILNDPGSRFFGRYVFNHAKYGVVDGRTMFVQSENLVRHGTPVSPTFGNRGWGVVIEDQPLAAYLARVFEADWNPAYGDVVEYRPGTPFGPPKEGFKPETGLLTGEYRHPFPALVVRGPVQVTPVLAPDHALLETRGIIGLMRGARKSLLIEQQYIHTYWGPAGSTTKTAPNIYLEEAIAAARRGVKVRILVGSAFLDPTDPRDNSHMIQYVNEIARREGLDMQARLIRTDLNALDKLHNKGIIVDERKVLVSSINWSYNSPANNREVGLILEHPTIGAYYTDIFTYDWYDGTPADYPLITEVDAVRGFVEITYPGPKPIAVGGWTLAAAAGRWTLPKVTLSPGVPLVLAADAKAFREKLGEVPSLAELPGLTLNGRREAVRLYHGDDLVDQMAWGEELPGWKLPAPARGSLCRVNPGKDTNTMLDWASASRPTPGHAGCGK